MTETTVQRSAKKSKAGAGIAGASGGTLLLHIFGKLPDDNSFKSTIILATPSIASALTILWLWAVDLIVEHKNEKKIKSLIEKGRNIISEELTRDTLSEEHKEKLKKYDSELGITNVEYILDRIKKLTTKDS